MAIARRIGKLRPITKEESKKQGYAIYTLHPCSLERRRNLLQEQEAKQNKVKSLAKEFIKNKEWF